MHLGQRVFLAATVAGLGTRSAAIPTRFTNITLVSASHHTSAATPAYSEISNAASYFLQSEGEPSRNIPVSNPIATIWIDYEASRARTADRKANHTAIQESSWKSVHESNLATGWNASGQQTSSTATQRQPLHLSTLPFVDGSTSASLTKSLAASLLEPATDTFAHVPTPQTIPGGRQGQNVDPSSLSLSASKHSPHHTTLGPLSQTATSDGRRQMSNAVDDTNNAITTANTIRPTAIMDDAIDPSNGVNNLISAVGNVATASADPTDALDVLLSALPSSVAQSLESQFSATATDALSTTRPTSRPTSRPTTRTTPSTTLPTSITSTPTSTSSSTTFTKSTRSTSSSVSSTSSSSSSTSTNAPPIDSDSSKLENNAVAGIASGVTAGAVLIILAVVFFLRRRQQGKAPFGPRASQRSKNSGRAYPEVAWLYDPAPTPPNGPSSSHHREESAASLLPQVREPEMAAMGAAAPLNSHPYRVHDYGNPYRSPEMRPVEADSPLLPPHMPAARDESPGGSGGSSPRSSSQSPRRSARSSFNSSGDGRRPLHAIFEESHAQ